jgi:hypothetical protein
VGGLALGIYNITLIVEDTSGNIVSDLVYVWVLEVTDIFIERNTADFIEYEVDTLGHFLNWTIVSVEAGTYRIFKDSTEITTTSFKPGEMITHPIDGLTIGTYQYTIEVTDNFGNYAQDSVNVQVISNPSSAEETTTFSSITAPPYTIPPYFSVPAGEFPWLFVIGVLGGLGLSVVGFFILTKRILLPNAIKENRRGLKKARKIKDKAEEAKRLHQLGKTFFELGDLKSSIKHNKEALDLYAELGDKKGQLRALEKLGDAYLAKGVEMKDD